MVAQAGETVLLAAPGLFHGEGEQPARRCLETGEPSPMDSEHPGGQQRQKASGEGTGFDSGWWECSVFSAPSHKRQW